jgi:hypothetical protein
MATVQGFKGIAKELLSQLKDRFDYVYDDKHMRFDGIHLISTALDPNLLVFLNDEMKRAIERNLIRCTQWVLGVSQLFLNIYSGDIISISHRRLRILATIKPLFNRPMGLIIWWDKLCTFKLYLIAFDQI